MTEVRVIREPRTYERGGPHSFFRDLCRSAFRADPESQLRLATHRSEMAVDNGEKRAAPSLSSGMGGEFAPPAWFPEYFSGANRAGRSFADIIPHFDLADGVTSINIPDVTVGVTAQPVISSGAVSTTDMTTRASSHGVTTIVGDLDVTQQLFDQTPSSAFDELMAHELDAAYNENLEYSILMGNGQARTPLGLVAIAGANVINGVTGTSITTFWPMLGKAASMASNVSKRRPEVFLMAPRRWFWITSQFDDAHRPICTPGSGAIAVLPEVMDQPIDGPVGPIMGLPTFLEGPLLPGLPTSNDLIITCKPSTMMLWESPVPRTFATPEPLSGILGVRLQMSRHVVFVGDRKPNTVACINNLPAPAGYDA